MDMNSRAANARKPSAMSMAIAATIRAERSAANLTKDDVLKKAGISRQTYYKLETGERVVDVSQLDAICRVLGLSLRVFMQRAEARLAEYEQQTTPDAPAQERKVR